MKKKCKILQIAKDTVWYGCISLGVLVLFTMFGHGFTVVFDMNIREGSIVLGHSLIGFIISLVSLLLIGLVQAYSEHLNNVCGEET